MATKTPQRRGGICKSWARATESNRVTTMPATAARSMIPA